MSDETTISDTPELDRLRALLDQLHDENIVDVVRSQTSWPEATERPYCWMVGYMTSLARGAVQEFDQQAVSA